MDHFKYEYLKKVGTMEELEYDSKINYSRNFSKSYGKMMIVLLLIMLAKRFLFSSHFEPIQLSFYMEIIVIFVTINFFQDYNTLATRLSPFFFVLLSFYGHIRFMHMQNYNLTEGHFESTQGVD